VNLIDILLIVLVLLSVLYGWRRGFLLGLLDLVGWGLVLVAALRYYQPVASWLGPRVDVWSEIWDQPLAFLFVAFVVGVAFQAIGYALLKRLPKGIHDRKANRILGLLPGAVSGLITAALASAGASGRSPISEQWQERARESVIVNRLACVCAAT
jgi:uncharacterized membrane protein required for colicin V production